MATNHVRVLIADDHALVRAGLRALLEREEWIEPIAEAATAEAAVDGAVEYRPDVVLMDVTMPGGSGIDAIPRLLDRSPNSKVLVLSMHDDPRYVNGAFAAGARGYVLKEAADVELVTAIREVAVGNTYVNPMLGACTTAVETGAHG